MIARLIVGTIREEPGSLGFESQRLNCFDKMSLVQLDWRSRCRIPKRGAPVDAYGGSFNAVQRFGSECAGVLPSFRRLTGGLWVACCAHQPPV
jgi:hypothetical protein